MPQSTNPAKVRKSHNKPFANDTTKRDKEMEVVQKREARLKDMYLYSLNLRAKAEVNRINRIQVKLKERLRKNIAYGAVLKQNRYNDVFKISKKKAMQMEYTLNGLKNHISDMIKKMNPAYKRQIEARDRMDAARAEYERITYRNLRRLPTARTRARRQLRQELLEANRELGMGRDVDDAAFVLTPSPTPRVPSELASPPPPGSPLPKINLHGYQADTRKTKKHHSGLATSPLPDEEPSFGLKKQFARVPPITESKAIGHKGGIIGQSEDTMSKTSTRTQPLALSRTQKEFQKSLNIVDIGALSDGPSRSHGRIGKRQSVPTVRTGSTTAKHDKSDEIRLPPVKKPGVMVARPKMKLQFRQQDDISKQNTVLPPIQA